MKNLAIFDGHKRETQIVQVFFFFVHVRCRMFLVFNFPNDVQALLWWVNAFDPKLAVVESNRCRQFTIMWTIEWNGTELANVSITNQNTFHGAKLFGLISPIRTHEQTIKRFVYEHDAMSIKFNRQNSKTVEGTVFRFCFSIRFCIWFTSCECASGSWKRCINSFL